MAFLQNEYGMTPTEVVLAALDTIDRSHPDVLTLATAAVVAVNDASTAAVEAADRYNNLAGKVKELGTSYQRLLKDYEQAHGEVEELNTRLRAERTLRQRAEAARDQALAQSTAADAAVDEAQVHGLRAELAAAWADRDLYAGLLDAAEAERDAAIRARALLCAQLADLRPDTDEAAEPQLADTEQAPGSFAEVFTQAAHPLLAFTLDLDVTAALDAHPNAPAWRRRTADALATAAAYATAKATVRSAGHPPGPELADLAAFARDGGPEVALSLGAIASGESRRVGADPRFAAARIFAVPEQINPTGRTPMFAHIRIGGVQPPAPRMHYYDDTARTGQFVIGYLGPHLPSTRTN